MERKKIDGSGTLFDLMSQMAENNPGAIGVLMDSLKDDPASLLAFLGLDDMNIRGTQIWVGFKDYCRQDKKLFWKMVQQRDENFVEAINRESAKQGSKYKAVLGGASYGNPEQIVFTEEEMKEFAEKPKMVHPKVKDKEMEF